MNAFGWLGHPATDAGLRRMLGHRSCLQYLRASREDCDNVVVDMDQSVNVGEFILLSTYVSCNGAFDEVRVIDRL